MSKIEIILGDAITELEKLESNSIDLIISDPPYNLGKHYGNNNDNKNYEEYLSFSNKWLKEAKRVLKKDGTLYVFMGVKFISEIFQILNKQLEMNFVNWICWHYTQGLGKTRGFSPRHDDILMFSSSKNYNFFLDSIRVPQKYYRSRNNMRGANPGDVWEFSHVHYCHVNRQEHPTQKPEGLIERMVLASSKEGDLILDPFNGSGTTLRVCQQLNRNAIGIELNPEYVENTKKRLLLPFDSFDSIDPKMKRVPKDINNTIIRNEYFQNHIKWFLKNHAGSIQEFWNSVEKEYGKVNINQLTLDI